MDDREAMTHEQDHARNLWWILDDFRLLKETDHPADDIRAAAEYIDKLRAAAHLYLVEHPCGQSHDCIYAVQLSTVLGCNHGRVAS